MCITSALNKGYPVRDPFVVLGQKKGAAKGFEIENRFMTVKNYIAQKRVPNK